MTRLIHVSLFFLGEIPHLSHVFIILLTQKSHLNRLPQSRLGSHLLSTYSMSLYPSGLDQRDQYRARGLRWSVTPTLSSSEVPCVPGTTPLFGIRMSIKPCLYFSGNRNSQQIGDIMTLKTGTGDSEIKGRLTRGPVTGLVSTRRNYFRRATPRVSSSSLLQVK